MKKILLVLAITSLVSGCGDSDIWDSSCESEMDDVRSKIGAPEEVDSYVSGSYSNVDWWYWSKGIAYTFTFYKTCEVSTYTFTPIK